MAKTGPRIKVALVSPGKNKANKATNYTYTTYKNTRNTPDKLALQKFDPYAWNEATGKHGMKLTFKEKKIPK